MEGRYSGRYIGIEGWGVLETLISRWLTNAGGEPSRTQHEEQSGRERCGRARLGDAAGRL